MSVIGDFDTENPLGQQILMENVILLENNDRGTGSHVENPNGQYKGYFYFANNISYGNGINGLVVHKSDNSIVVNNTIYLNGAVPLDE